MRPNHLPALTSYLLEFPSTSYTHDNTCVYNSVKLLEHIHKYWCEPSFFKVVHCASLLTRLKTLSKSTKKNDREEKHCSMHFSVIFQSANIVLDFPPARYKIALWFLNDWPTNVPNQSMQQDSENNLANCFHKSDSTVFDFFFSFFPFAQTHLNTINAII